MGTRKVGQVQQTLHSWRNSGGNYNINQSSPYSNNTNNINNESINGNIKYLCDNTNKITIKQRQYSLAKISATTHET